MKPIRPLHIIALTLFLISSAAPLPGQSSAKPKPKQENRFLIVLNTSSAMSRRSENMQNVAGNLMASGLKGEMKNGDTLGVWTYNETLHTGQFPLRKWSIQARQDTAAALVEFIKQQKFEKRTRFTNVMESLSALTKISERLTVLILTDGAETISGTPFDNEINASFKLNEADQRKAKMPFVVVLRSEKGKFIGHTVNVPPWPVEFPKFTPEPVVITPPKPPPEEQVVVPSLIISNPPPRVETAPVIPTATNSHAATATAPPETPDTNLASQVNVTDAHTATNSAPATTETNLVAKKISQSSQGDLPASNPNESAKKKAGINPTVVWVAVACVLLGVMGLIFALTHRNRSKEHVSLITRSMGDKKK
ncbi:MAG: hypothetical protein HOP33_21600 [Verrucomicrobia bacterium]|nr:hypothetical protein [Verrucomicrobiota bacterium]